MYVKALEWNPDELTDADVEAIGCLKGLDVLAINCGDLTDKKLRQLPIPRHLSALVIVGAGVTDAGFERLKELRDLGPVRNSVSVEQGTLFAN